ncbi:GntR family transcriptional regulator [Cryptosporangium sp. NPDC048952]|uniref:GntR family transcriptional regulator n=1 Tax=Cryptosporangium sp. NPDC048952 TaxID=3363961 RepID=UPI00371D3649
MAEQVFAPKSQYRQIADLLRERIDAGFYEPDDPLPSEPELAAELGVSRVTINKAISLLRISGLVRVRRGAGTYVRTTPRITRDARYRYAHPRAAELEGRALGLSPRAECTEVSKVEATTEVAAALGIDEGDPVVVRHRRLFADDEPTRLADAYLPWDIAEDAGLLEPEGTELLESDAGSGAVYARLAERGHGPARFDEDVTVRVASDAEARALDLEDGQPVIHITHVARDADDRAVEVALHVMPAHLWRLHYDWSALVDDEYDIENED